MKEFEGLYSKIISRKLRNWLNFLSEFNIIGQVFAQFPKSHIFSVFAESNEIEELAPTAAEGEDTTSEPKAEGVQST